MWLNTNAMSRAFIWTIITLMGYMNYSKSHSKTLLQQLPARVSALPLAAQRVRTFVQKNKTHFTGPSTSTQSWYPQILETNIFMIGEFLPEGQFRSASCLHKSTFTYYAQLGFNNKLRGDALLNYTVVARSSRPCF